MICFEIIGKKDVDVTKIADTVVNNAKNRNAKICKTPLLTSDYSLKHILC